MVFATIAADLDFLPGIFVGNPDWLHHRGTHSLLAAAAFGIAAALIARARGIDHAPRLGLLLAVGYASHLLMDMMATDSRPRYGVPLFWPSTLYVNAPINLFLPIERESGGADFVSSLLSWHNAVALIREALVMGTVWITIYLATRSRRDGSHGKAGRR